MRILLFNHHYGGYFPMRFIYLFNQFQFSFTNTQICLKYYKCVCDRELQLAGELLIFQIVYIYKY